MSLVRLIKIDKTSKVFKDVVRENLTDRVRDDDSFAQKLYASLCNTVWINKSTNDIYSCTWRYAGRFVAEIRDKGEDYLNFYCSGGEGLRHSVVYNELKKLGYVPLKDKVFDNLQENDFKW